MGTISTRTNAAGKKRHRAQVRIKGAPALSNTLPTKRLAQAWINKVEGDIKSGKFLPRVQAETYTLGEAIRRYESEILPAVKLAEKTKKQRRQHFKAWLEVIGDLSIAQITPATIDTARSRLLKRMSPQSTNRYLASLGRLTRAMVTWGWCATNPLTDFERFKEAPGRERFLTVEEAQVLCAEAAKVRNLRQPPKGAHSQIDGRLHALVLTALGTGARQGELLSLKWSDVDLESGKARLGTTKNGTARTLHLHDSVLDVLRERSKVPHFTGFVFAADETKPGTVPTFPRGHWHRAREAAGLDDITFHTLRHTFASWAAMNGATLMELAHLLGHKTLAMVKRYAHLAEEHGVDVSRRVVGDLLAR